MNLLYKFVPASTALAIIETQRLKVSRLAALNDVFDCLPRFDTQKTSEDPSADLQELHHGIMGITCFSRAWKSPLLWGHYAAGGTGLALGFDEDALGWGNSLPVDYSRERPAIAEEGGITSDFVRASVLVKAEEWRYEEEVRFIEALDECIPSGGMYFRRFPPDALKQVVMGCRSTLEIGYLRHFISNCYATTIDVIASKPSPTHYEVVKDEMRSRKR